ncbi:6259_t:CDS:2 [Paraglomus brasilianum]|uniref:6259_t:CDS:1 n=1 Tax=Paraglomus brasilianum TaxID=144538 RepID=A0A9N8VXS6_9GLOM|nr:6259_t:CDS:2 [Paraglomus brasilianum]
MVRKKTQSKRLSAAKRYKILKNVAEHKRKERREAKKNPSRKSLKKDPGIPNLYPYKDKILHQLEEQKRKLEEEKARQRQARVALHNKKRNLNLTDLVEDATTRTKLFDNDRPSDANDSVTAIDPAAAGLKDNSRKAFYGEFKKVIKNADVILEVLDARDPLGCRSTELERMVIDSGVNKRLILILNKVDLVPKEIVSKWLTYLRNEYPAIAFKSSTQSQRTHLGHSSTPISLASESSLHTSECFGASTLLKLLKNYSRNLNIKTSITVGVIGYPNVGKSSLINSLKRAKVCAVGATPGSTKTSQEVQLDSKVKLLDCPGILWGENDAEMSLRNCIKAELLEDPVAPVELIVSRCPQQLLVKRYNIPPFRDANDFLIQVARQRGRLKRGGIPDIVSAARSVLQDWNTGQISFYTTPPTQSSSGGEVTLVQQWGKEFDLDNLVLEDVDMLQ